MLTLQTIPVPLREEADGALRVGATRVLLEMVIHAFEDGASPESIVESYSTLRLPDVYAVIAHYLNHRDQVAEYLAMRERKATEVAERLLSSQGDLADLRRRLLARKNSAE